MKKILIPIIVLSMLFTLSVSVYAEEGDAATPDPGTVEAGMTPDSPLYFLDTLIDSLKVIFTPTSEGKAEVLVSIAKERLAEAGIMSDENKDELVEKTMEAFLEVVEKANEYLEEAAEGDADITASLESIQIVQDDGQDFVIQVLGQLPDEFVAEAVDKISAEVEKTLGIMVIKELYVEVKEARQEVKDLEKLLEDTEGLTPEEILQLEADLEAAQIRLAEANIVCDEVQSIKEEILGENASLGLGSQGQDNGKSENKPEKDGETPYGWAVSDENIQQQTQEKLEQMAKSMEKNVEKIQEKIDEKIADEDGKDNGKSLEKLQEQIDKTNQQAQEKIDDINNKVANMTEKRENVREDHPGIGNEEAGVGNKDNDNGNSDQEDSNSNEEAGAGNVDQGNASSNKGNSNSDGGNSGSAGKKN